MQKVKMAIIYDWIDKWGGVERVLLELHKMFPQAEFYTSYYDGETAPWAKNLLIKTSFIQKLPSFIRKNRFLSLFLYPFAFESFDFSSYDVVISVTSSFAKGIITKPQTLHICYLLTPTRFLWVQPENYLKNPFIRSLLNPFINHLKQWDKIASLRPDRIISISKTVADRCKKYYGRPSEVIYPPFDIEYWRDILDASRAQRGQDDKPKPFYLVVSRLEPYKKIDLVIKAFKNRPETLIIVGKGSQKNYLRRVAWKNTLFYESLTDSELAEFYASAEALIMAQEEDFGYVSLEAQFFGCPVLAYKKGGAMETVLEHKTGLFFDQQTVNSLMEVLEKYSKISYTLKRACSVEGPKNVVRFDSNSFSASLRTK